MSVIGRGAVLPRNRAAFLSTSLCKATETEQDKVPEELKFSGLSTCFLWKDAWDARGALQRADLRVSKVRLQGMQC